MSSIYALCLLPLVLIGAGAVGRAPSQRTQQVMVYGSTFGERAGEDYADGAPAMCNSRRTSDQDADSYLRHLAVQRLHGSMGGAHVVVRSEAELQAAIGAQRFSWQPLTIVVDGAIHSGSTLARTWIDIHDVDNVTIIGSDAGAEFVGIRVRLTHANNIRLRRIYAPMLVIGSDESIILEGHMDDVRIDHSEFADEPDCLGLVSLGAGSEGELHTGPQSS